MPAARGIFPRAPHRTRPVPNGLRLPGTACRRLSRAQVVPTTFTDLKNRTLATNQFSVTENFRDGGSGGPGGPGGKTLPGAFFFYDLSPIKVQIREQASSFLHFLTSVCAIVGGVFTVSGIVDGLVYGTERLIRKKMELGKFS